MKHATSRPNARLLSEGRRRASRLLDRFGAELRVARVTAGLSQRQLATLVGVSQGFVSLVELGLRVPSWAVACSLAAGVGHDLSVRLFPAASVRLRDSGQLGIVLSIVEQAHGSWHRRLEQRVSASPGDRRAADLVLAGADEILHIEVERRLVDLQAQLRSAQLKRAELAAHSDRPVRLVLALPDTRSIRATVGSANALLRISLPATSASVWRSVRTGMGLGTDGILFVRVPRNITRR